MIIKALEKKIQDQIREMQEELQKKEKDIKDL